MRHEEVIDNLVDLFTTRIDKITNDVMILRQLLIAKGFIREDMKIVSLLTITLSYLLIRT